MYVSEVCMYDMKARKKTLSLLDYLKKVKRSLSKFPIDFHENTITSLIAFFLHPLDRYQE